MKLLKIAKKFVTNFLMGLKIWDEVGVGGPLFSKLQQVGEFSYFGLKVWFSIRKTNLEYQQPVRTSLPSFPSGPAKNYTNERAKRASILLR